METGKDDIVDDFVTKFYLLEGNLIGERKKNFSLLLRDLAAHSDPQLNQNFLIKMQPRNYLESLFRIDALIYFKITSELLKLLKENNDVFLSKIFKQQWFFESAFKNMSAEAVFNDYVPQMSFSNKKKFLKNYFPLLSQDYKDILYSALNIRYGLWFSRNFLHLCSADKIKETLEKEEIKLQSNQVIHLFDRDEKLFVYYVEYYKKTFNRTYFDSDRKVSQYVGNKNVHLFIQLINDEKIVLFKLGKRTSKKAFPIVKSDIPQNFKKYRILLNNNVMFRRLGGDFKNIYFESLPVNFKQLSIYSQFYFLKYLPKSKRWNIFVDTVFAKFPDHNVMELSFEDILRYCPDRSLVKKKAEAMFKNTEENRFLRYIDPSTSVPIIKEKINVTSDKSVRKKLLDLLLETCSENKDLNMLESVLKYICYRHRNEEILVRYNILNTIHSSFNLNEFNENHWNYINEQINVLRIQKEFSSRRFKDLSNGYLEFLFKNHLDFKAAVKQYIDDILVDGHFEILNLKNPTIEQQILIEIFKYTDQDYIKPVKNRDDFMDIISAIISFNDKNPEFSIEFECFKTLNQYVYSLFSKTCDFTYSDFQLLNKVLLYKHKHPNCFSYLNDSIILGIFSSVHSAEKTYELRPSLKNFILKKNRNTLENELMINYFKLFIDNCPNVDILNWYLKNEPHSIVPYFQKIILAIDKIDLNLYLCKFYSHFSFDRQLIEFFQQKLQNEKPANKDRCVNKYKILLTTDQFIEVLNQFLPKKEKLDMKDEKMVEIYNVQCSIVKQLHHVLEPHKLLPIIMKFSLGDYLQSAVPALYSIFYRSPEQLLHPYIDELSKRAVSARKHALFLTCELLDEMHSINILTVTEHSNISSQKHLFSATLKYFQKNPSDTLLNLVIKNMCTIDKNDTETLESLKKKYHDLPKKYKVPYIEKCWSFYESLEQDVKIEQYLTKLLSALVGNKDILKKLSISFVQDILNKYLITTKLHNSIDFAINVLLYREFERTKNFDLVFSLISKMNKKYINNFFRETISFKLDLEFVSEFNQYWIKNFAKIDTFWEHIFLDLSIQHLSTTSQDSFARNVVNYLNEFIREYSIYAFDLFKDAFNCLLVNETELYRYQLLEKLLLYQKTVPVCMLILKIMDPVDSESTSATTFRNILNILKNVRDPVVVIHFKNYMSDNNLE